MIDFSKITQGEWEDLLEKGDPEALKNEADFWNGIQKELINSHTFQGDLWAIHNTELPEEIRVEAAERMIENYFKFNQVIVPQRRSIMKKGIGQRILFGQMLDNPFEDEWKNSSKINLFIAEGNVSDDTLLSDVFSKMRRQMGLLAEEYYFDGDKLDDRKLKGGRYASIIAFYDETTEVQNGPKKIKETPDIVKSAITADPDASNKSGLEKDNIPKFEYIKHDRPTEEEVIEKEQPAIDAQELLEIQIIVGKDDYTFMESYRSDRGKHTEADHSKMYRLRKKIEKKRQVSENSSHTI